MLTIKNYSKIYKGNKKAVDNLSLTVEAGDIYGFIGHNGAGKTTTLRAVVGVLDEADVVGVGIDHGAAVFAGNGHGVEPAGVVDGSFFGGGAGEF